MLHIFARPQRFYPQAVDAVDTFWRMVAPFLLLGPEGEKNMHPMHAAQAGIRHAEIEYTQKGHSVHTPVDKQTRFPQRYTAGQRLENRHVAALFHSFHTPCIYDDSYHTAI